MTTRIALFLIAIGSLAGCNRTHLSKNFGQVYRHNFSKQVISPHGWSKNTEVTGLDPEESGIVLSTYRKTMSPIREVQPDRTPVIIAPPQAPPVNNP